MIHRCEKFSSPSSEWPGLLNVLGDISILLSKAVARLACRGTARFSLNTVLITPIGLNVHTSASSSLVAPSCREKTSVRRMPFIPSRHSYHFLALSILLLFFPAPIAPIIIQNFHNILNLFRVHVLQVGKLLPEARQKLLSVCSVLFLPVGLYLKFLISLLAVASCAFRNSISESHIFDAKLITK